MLVLSCAGMPLTLPFRQSVGRKGETISKLLNSKREFKWPTCQQFLSYAVCGPCLLAILPPNF